MESSENKELDLIDILKTCACYIASFFRLIYKGLIWILRFMYKNKVKLGAFLVAGFLIALFVSRKDNLAYKANTIMTINLHDAYFFNDLISTLDSYCLNENKSLLKNALGVSDIDAKNIIAVKSYFFIDKLIDGTPDEIDFEKKYDHPTDTTSVRMKDRLYVQVIVKDTTILKNMTQYLFHYFSNNSILNSENEIRLKQMDENINSTNNEISMLDSLRKLEYFKRNKDASINMDKTVLLNEKEKKLYHSDIFELEHRKHQMQWTKEVNNQSVTFISEFNAEAKAANRLSQSAIKYMSLMFVLGVIFSLFWNFRTNIKDFLNK